MRRSSLRYSLLAAITLLPTMSSMAWCDSGAEPGAYDASGSGYQSIVWNGRGDACGPRGLLLFDVSPSGYSDRLLVFYGEREWRVILTTTLDPVAGLDTKELFDDVTGWWIRLETRFEVQGETLGTFFARARQLPPVDDATGFTRYRLTTSDGFAFELQIPRSKFEIWEELFDQLEAAELVNELASRVPEGFRAAVLFLDVSLMERTLTEGIADQPRTFAGLLGLLGSILRTSLPAADPRRAEFAVPWTMTVEGGGKGSSLVEPHLLELASQFRAVENADPLIGHRADDLAAPPVEP